MYSRFHERFVHIAFTAGVLAKGIWGAMETAGSIFLVFASATLLARITAAFTAAEFSDGFLTTAVTETIGGPSGDVRLFGIIYLLLHGIVNLILSLGLLRHRLWAFPTAIAIISSVAAYQTYQFAMSASVFVAGLTLFDMVMVWLIWHKWQHLLAPNTH
jgi:uncharacterized membrane protein